MYQKMQNNNIVFSCVASYGALTGAHAPLDFQQFHFWLTLE